MNARELIVSIAAGAAAAALTLSALSASVGGILLSSLAQLPIFLVGLSLGTQAAALATAGSVAAASILVRLDFGLVFGLAVGLPVVVFVRQALLSRRRADGGIEWYPPAGLLITCLALTTIVAATALPAALDPSPGQVARAREVLAGLPPELRPADVTPEALDRLVRFALGPLPGFLGIGFFFLLVANAAIAQAILVRFGWNIRPTPAMSSLALPGWFATAAAIAAIGAMFPGAAGVAGTSLAMICALGFAFSGLAVVHALVLNSGARGVLLAVAYAAIFLFAPAIVLVLLLGIVEPWTRLRERFAGPAPGL